MTNVEAGFFHLRSLRIGHWSFFGDCGLGNWSFLAAVLLLLTGCQSGPLRLSAPPLSVAAIEPETKIGDAEAAEVHVATGRSLEKKGATAEAINAYQAAVRYDPKRADAYGRLAVLHDLQGKFQESEPFHRKAVEASPKSADLYCNWGYSLYLQRRWAEAETQFREAIKLNPKHQRAHNNLGLVLAHCGRAEEALAEFRLAGCSEAGAYTNLAFVRTLEGDGPAAQQHYEHALTIEPAHEPARKGLEEVKTLMARAQTAKNSVPSE